MSQLAASAPHLREHLEREGHHHTWVPPTSKSAYLTGDAALNLPDPVYPGGGDWHRACWQVPVEGVPAAAHAMTLAHTTELGPLMRLFGTRELHDYRAGLRAIGHPAGERETPIWGASHVRCVLEMAWECITLETEDADSEKLLRGVDPQTVARWLAEPMQWLKLQWWAWRIEVGPARSIGADRAWRGWRRHLTPYADYRTPERTFEWWLYPMCAAIAIVSAATRIAASARK